MAERIRARVKTCCVLGSVVVVLLFEVLSVLFVIDFALRVYK